MSLSYSGSLPRSSGTSGSAPDLTSEYRHAGGSSPVTELWTNPLHDGTVPSTVSRDHFVEKQEKSEKCQIKLQVTSFHADG